MMMVERPVLTRARRRRVSQEWANGSEGQQLEQVRTQLHEPGTKGALELVEQEEAPPSVEVTLAPDE